jgi:hypothetical protein
MSISLFFGEVRFFSKVKGSAAAAEYFHDNYIRAVRIITDAGASCMVYELRDN